MKRQHQTAFARVAFAMATAVGALFTIQSQALDFNFNFTDPIGVGFNASGSVGADRQAGLNMAAGIVESVFTAYPVTINIDVNGSQTDDNTLASAGSNFNDPSPTPGFGNRGDVGLIILGLGDPAPGAADGTVDWNFEDFQWEPLSDFQPGELDLISTAAHELLHAVGFSSDIAQNGNDPFGNTPGNPGLWVPFDDFVADPTGDLINDGTFALDRARWDAASIEGTGTVPPSVGLYFDGPNATAANGGNPVPLYSPTTWSGGSSGSHLDTDFFTPPNSLMMNHESPVFEGLDIRVIDAITIGILQDIGFTQAGAIPEPSTAVLLVMSLAAFGARVGRRQN